MICLIIRTKRVARVEVNISLAFLHWLEILNHIIHDCQHVFLPDMVSFYLTWCRSWQGWPRSCPYTVQQSGLVQRIRPPCRLRVRWVHPVRTIHSAGTVDRTNTDCERDTVQVDRWTRSPADHIHRTHRSVERTSMINTAQSATNTTHHITWRHPYPWGPHPPDTQVSGTDIHKHHTSHHLQCLSWMFVHSLGFSSAFNAMLSVTTVTNSISTNVNFV